VNFKEIQLVTALTPEECVSRLTAAIAIERSGLLAFSGLDRSKPVVGHVTRSRLRLRKRIEYRNSFQSHLTATMRPGPEGTIISGEVAMHPVVQAFLFIWFGFVILVGLGMLLAAVGSKSSHSGVELHNGWLGAFVISVMLIFGYGLVRAGRHLARDEGRYLSDFLIRTLDAREQG